MALKHGILGFLIYGVTTGYELNKSFKDSVDNFWHATSSQIYRELDWLESHGMASGSVVIQNGKPNKKTYVITEKGRVMFNDWLISSEEEPMIFRSSFLMRVFFSGLASTDESIRLLEQFKEQCAALRSVTAGWAEHIEHYKDSVEDGIQSFYWSLTADYGRRHLDMCEAWAGASIEKIKNRKGEPG